VNIAYQHNDATAQIRLGDAWRVKPQEEMLEGLRALVDARFVY
jgi:hypothetical protein